MKKILIVGILMPLLFVFGCMSEQQANDIRTFSQKVDSYQNVVTELKEAFVADKVISESTAAKVDKVNEWLDENQPVLENIATAVENAPDNIANKIDAGVQKAAPLIPPPFNMYATGISALAALIFGKKSFDNGRALAVEADKRRAEKVGRIKTINELATMREEDITAGLVKARLYCNIGDERTKRNVA